MLSGFTKEKVVLFMKTNTDIFIFENVVWKRVSQLNKSVVQTSDYLLRLKYLQFHRINLLTFYLLLTLTEFIVKNIYDW